jgi:hypothetical protein
VIAHPERKAQRVLQRLAGAALGPVDVVADLAALEAAVDAETIAVVDAQLAHTRPNLRTRPARAWIAVPGEGVSPADPKVACTLMGEGWDHVVTQPMPLLAEELLATVQKLVRADPFGLEKYMAWGTEIQLYELNDTRDRDEVVTALAHEISAVGLPDRIGSLFSVIADELVANAMYAAPVDGSGNRHRALEPRDRGRALAGKEIVSLRWATDGRYLGIEIRDRWGSIVPVAIAPRLATPKQNSGEGGMGMALAFACSNQLVINHAPGQLTEVIALLDIRYKPTELARTASFHAFAGTWKEESVS